MRRRLLVLGALYGVLSLSLPLANAEAHAHPALRHWYYHSGASCVHRYEGSWTDPGAPYWGGFQMSLWFQEHYAPRRYAVAGTADHWTIWHQMAVVRRVVRSSGWGQWPNTARYCGLL